MKRIGGIALEAIKSAASQPVASVLTIVLVAGMVVAVMLTTGRSVAAEQQVLSTIDSSGTRSIIVRAEPDAGLTSDVLDRIASVSGIEWAGAFSTALDATNAAVLDGTRVPVRTAFSRDFSPLGVSDSPLDAVVYASAEALAQFGLPDVAGAIQTTDGARLGMAGTLRTPDFLDAFSPLVIEPRRQPRGDEPVAVLVVIAERPDLVSPVSDAVLSVLAVDDATKVTVQTSEALANLRAIIQSQLGTFARGLVLLVLGVMGALVAMILTGLVMMRRKDFGRRRALGASRVMIIGLLLTQTAVLATIGVIAGSAASAIILLSTTAPLPNAAFFCAIGILGLATATIAALAPALIASRREPIRELRVP